MSENEHDPKTCDCGMCKAEGKVAGAWLQRAIDYFYKLQESGKKPGALKDVVFEIKTGPYPDGCPRLTGSAVWDFRCNLQAPQPGVVRVPCHGNHPGNCPENNDETIRCPNCGKFKESP